MRVDNKIKIQMMIEKAKVRLYNLIIVVNNWLVKLHYMKMYDSTGSITRELQRCHHIKLGWMTYVTFGFLIMLLLIKKLI